MSKNIKKVQFREFVDKSGRQIDYLSDWQFDNRYLEYKLFMLLDGYRDKHDFIVLGLPDSIEDYDICAKTPVTLNAELYRFYACGYFFFQDDFIAHVVKVLKYYVTGTIKVKDLVAQLRKKRLDHEKGI